MNPQLRAPSFDDFDTPRCRKRCRFRGAIMILVGCTIAAVLGLFGLSLASPPRTPRYSRTNSVSLVANNQGARDDIYAMLITEIQRLVAKLDALDVAAVPEKTCDFTAISITP